MNASSLASTIRPWPKPFPEAIAQVREQLSKTYPLHIGGQDVTTANRIAQEEVFGPELSIMRTKDFAEALEWANSTRFALTGAIFSTNKEHLDRAVGDFRVGNRYLNRSCVGALVKVQPFGRFKMSGVGTKARGPDYLLHFMDPRSVTQSA